MTPLSIDVARELHPPRVHAGTPSRIDLRVRNLGRLRAPVLNLRDGVSGTHGANLIVPPLAAEGVARAAYRLPTERRGILTVGPLEVMLSDPFGLTNVTMQASGVSELTVYPHIDDIAPVPQTTGNDPMAGAEHPNALGRNGEDFYALRQYVVGDDLRRVHWPSTARHDELMVRQDELPWQGRATVLLDVRSSTNNAESIELVISAGASIVTANARRQDLVRLVSTDGGDSGFAAGHPHVESILEHLASVAPTNEANYRRVIDRLARSSTGGALVVVVALMPGAELEQLVRLRNRFGSLRIVQFDPSSWGSTGPGRLHGSHTRGHHPCDRGPPLRRGVERGGRHAPASRTSNVRARVGRNDRTGSVGATRTAAAMTTTTRQRVHRRRAGAPSTGRRARPRRRNHRRRRELLATVPGLVFLLADDGRGRLLAPGHADHAAAGLRHRGQCGGLHHRLHRPRQLVVVRVEHLLRRAGTVDVDGLHHLGARLVERVPRAHRASASTSRVPRRRGGRRLLRGVPRRLGRVPAVVTDRVDHSRAHLVHLQHVAGFRATADVLRVPVLRRLARVPARPPGRTVGDLVGLADGRHRARQPVVVARRHRLGRGRGARRCDHRTAPADRQRRRASSTGAKARTAGRAHV